MSIWRGPYRGQILPKELDELTNAVLRLNAR